jgi:hypothetical protein
MIFMTEVVGLFLGESVSLPGKGEPMKGIDRCCSILMTILCLK